MMIKIPMRAIYFPGQVRRRSGALFTCKTPIIPSATIPIHTDKRTSIRKPIINIPKSAISKNAVGLAILANAKKNHETATYFSASLCTNVPSLCESEMNFKKINPESIAKIVNAITPRSVLLSTKTKNAPIPLVNQNNIPVHPKEKES